MENLTKINTIRTFRSWNKSDLYAILLANKYTIGAEIGVLNGEFFKSLRRMYSFIKLYLIDPYKKYDDVAVLDSQLAHDARYNMVKELIVDTNSELIRESSKDAILRFKDESLDFVYIDAAHDFENVYWDIKNWYKKIKKNGIICGHDYDLEHDDVQRAVGIFCKENNIRLLTVCTMSAIWIIKKETENEQSINSK